MPKYKVDEFQLSYTTQKSLYKISLEDESPQFTWNKVANSNAVLIDFTNKTYQAEKVIYDKSYRIEDSLPALQWTLLEEYRVIAGYNCRKASTIIMDSIYVIAFYTNEIPVSGGPESFNGLPGMILGLVMPRLNTTYFATKNETQLIAETSFVMPKSKSKKTNFKGYNDELSLALKDWGEYAAKVLWKANL
jgi:GLPGLI family protein